MVTEKPGKVLDVEVALAHVGDDRELLSELAAMFVQDYPRLIHEASEAILQNDHAVLERAAHTLKGRLAFFGVAGLKDRLAELERMGREQDLNQASERLNEIKDQMTTVLLEFEPLMHAQS